MDLHSPEERDQRSPEEREAREELEHARKLAKEGDPSKLNEILKRRWETPAAPYWMTGALGTRLLAARSPPFFVSCKAKRQQRGLRILRVISVEIRLISTLPFQAATAAQPEAQAAETQAGPSEVQEEARHYFNIAPAA